jgi:hypothetical protein
MLDCVFDNIKIIFIFIFKFKFLLRKYNIFVMNMAERAEEIDYEADVLKFKKIWE